MNANPVMPNLIKNVNFDEKNVNPNAAKLIGNTQYPNTQTLWKNETWPPNNFAFTLIIYNIGTL